MKKIYVSDFTLKKLAQERKNPLLFREKVAIATAIDSMGVDTVELSPVANFKEDRIINKTISAAVKNAAIAIPVGSTEESVKEAYECIRTAKTPILQVVFPLSTVQMEYSYHMKAPKMMGLIEKIVKAAKALCENVEFVAVDATRAEEKVLEEALKLAIDCGATAITICDDASTMFPVDFAEFVKKVKSFVSVPVYVKVSAELYMETATAFESIIAGADGIKVVFEGTKELKTNRIATVIASKGEAYGVCTSLDTRRLSSDMKSLAGKIDSTEEVAPAKSVNDDDVYLDAASTIENISEAAEKLGYALTEEDAGNVLRGLKRVCEKRNSIGTREFEALIASYAMQAPSTYHLDYFTTSNSNLTSAMANVALTKNGEIKVSGTGVGDGPIDAAFGAIEQGVGHHYELDDFQINTVTEGKDSLGSALIKLRHNGKVYSGNGISTDIVGSCIRAYINALNKIVNDED
jgi:2-isopropylmalate synthase